MATAEHWRTSQRELHKFITTIADFVSDSSRREAWLRILTEYPNEVSAAEKAIEDWSLAKSNYMEREIFEPGNEHLRDITNPPDDLFPQWHQRNLAPSEYDALPEHIQNAVYWNWNPASNEKEAIPCFRERERNKVRVCNELSVQLWCPLHYLEFDVSKRVHDPLPPSKTGRDGFGADRYTLPEICHSLTLLHDLDGAYGELAPRDSQLYLHFNDDSSALRMGVAETANNSWVEDLRPLANRLFDSVRRDGIAGPAWDEHTLARNKWVYDQRMAGTKLESIKKGIPRQCESWEPLSTSGINHVAQAYAVGFNLPLPVPRKKGRPKAKPESEKLK